MNLCRVSIDEIAHDRPIGKYQRAHSERVNELLDGMFDPFSDDNFQSFFSADLSHEQVRNLLGMRDELKAGNYEAAAAIFTNVLTNFYRGLAFDEATNKLLNAYCRHCYDSGCPACLDMEVE